MNPVLVWLSLAAAVVADEALLKSVPTVDLSAPTEESVATMQSALKQWGFFYVKNQGVSASLVQEQFGAAQAVFALPTQDKTRYNDNSGNSTVSTLILILRACTDIVTITVLNIVIFIPFVVIIVIITIICWYRSYHYYLLF